MEAARAPSAASRVVMVDVARRAGVSQKTVSRVVNNAPYVRADVRDRVNQAIAELGYRPNVAAQALARERTHTVGVLTLGTPLHGPADRINQLVAERGSSSEDVGQHGGLGASGRRHDSAHVNAHFDRYGPMTINTALADAVAGLRAEVARLHGELPRWGLVVWTAGNVSARVPGHNLLVIKPSGVGYDELTPEAMVITDLEGNLVDGDRSPSSDTAAHAYVYKHMPEVGGVVHTHSTYATAWAARGEPIPCVLTMMADEFGGEIPVGPFALIGDDSIGHGIVETLRGHRSSAVLMQNHGPFTVGPTAKAAVKAAVMCEEVARTVHIACQLGEPLAIAQSDIDSLYARYQNVYGQPGSK